ncbi:MAG: hypothetical protein J5833_06435 [Victivallales bacterium]|nr:hypothetical protein [Victivallales bacterium]
MSSIIKGMALAALSFACMALGEEVLLRRQSVPRANSFTFGSIVFSIENDTDSPSEWTINASDGAEVRRVHVTRNGTDFVYFPGKVLSVQNWGLAGRDKWNSMAETVGDCEVKAYLPAEVAKKGEWKIAAEKRNGLEHLLFGNGSMSFACIPSLNGIVYSFRDEQIGYEFFLNNAVGGKLDLRSYDKVGFIELFDSVGKTPEAAMSWEQKDGVITLKGESSMKKGCTLTREMRLRDFSVTLHTALSGGNEQVLLKHRPMMAKPQSIGIFMPVNGRLAPRNVQPNMSYETSDSCYAMVNRDNAQMLCISYKNASQLYVWMGGDFYNAEAFGIKASSAANPTMTAHYFLVHGMSRVDFIGDNVALAIPETLQVVENKDIAINMQIGAGISMGDLALVAAIGDARQSIPVKPPVAGFADSFAATLPTAALKPGQYKLNLTINEGGTARLSGVADLTVVSEETVREQRRKIDALEKSLQELRRKFAETGDASLMKEFKRISREKNVLENNM